MMKDQKEYCVHNLVVSVLEKMHKQSPKKPESEIAAEFMASTTYKKLIDLKTRLWAEGPDYILDMYMHECTQ